MSILPYSRPKGLENEEIIYVELARDLESDVMISVTMFYFFYTNDTTKHNFVSISSFSRPKNTKIRKLSTELMHGIKVTVISVNGYYYYYYYYAVSFTCNVSTKNNK